MVGRNCVPDKPKERSEIQRQVIVLSWQHYRKKPECSLRRLRPQHDRDRGDQQVINRIGNQTIVDFDADLVPLQALRGTPPIARPRGSDTPAMMPALPGQPLRDFSSSSARPSRRNPSDVSGRSRPMPMRMCSGASKKWPGTTVAS